MRSLIALALIFFFVEISVCQTEGIAKLKSAIHSNDDSTRLYSIKDLVFIYANRDVDSAKSYLRLLDYEAKATQNDFYIAFNHTVFGAFNYLTGNYDSALLELRTALYYNKKIKRVVGEANNYNLMGNVFSSLKQLDSSAFYYQKARSLFLESKTNRGLLNVTINLGVLYSDLIGDYARSLSYYYEALDYAQRDNDIESEATIYLNIGNLLSIVGRYEEAEAELKKGIDISEKIDDWDEMLYGYDVLATLLLKTGQHKEAVETFEKHLFYTRKIKDPQLIFFSMDDLIHAYSASKQWDKALKLANESLLLLTAINLTPTETDFHKINLYLQLARNNHYLKKFAESKKYLKLAEAIPIPSELSTSQKYNLLGLFGEVYESLGYYKQSLEYFKQKTAYNDSINSQENQQVMLDLQTKYETEKKEQEIQNLKQTATIQDLEISKKNNQIALGGLFLFLIVGGGFIYHSQYKSKKEKAEIQLEQRFLRSQMNPHFIFNSIGAIQHYLLTESAEKTSEYLGMFSTLMRQILENSRQDFITLEEEIDMLSNYLELQKLRFQGNFEYHIDIDEELDEAYCGIPPMFAQPFIENSLEHGLFKKGHKNEIIIKFKKTTSNLIQLEVTDSGVGFTAKKEDGHKSLATQITKERLERMKASHKLNVGVFSENLKDKEGVIEGYRIQLDLPSKLVAA
ncbi:MAG: tetratricopeptide repeat protein [Bacteroidota bacterium]